MMIVPRAIETLESGIYWVDLISHDILIVFGAELAPVGGWTSAEYRMIGTYLMDLTVG